MSDRTMAGSMSSVIRGGAKPTSGRARGGLSPCVCNTLRMVTRVITQLYDDCLRPSGLRVTQFSILATIAHLGEASLKQLEDELTIDQTTLTPSLGLLERGGVIERASHPTGGSKRCGSPQGGDEPWRGRGPCG